jgi:hypothetical protein
MLLALVPVRSRKTLVAIGRNDTRTPLVVAEPGGEHATSDNILYTVRTDGRYPIGGRRPTRVSRVPREHGDDTMDTYNLYMDEIPADDGDDSETVDVEFRVVPASEDSSDDANTPVVAGLDLVDLINLRDALSQEIDNYALSALEAEATAALGAED